MLKNIIFDMGGVLIEFDPALFLKRMKFSEEDTSLLLNALKECNFWDLTDSGILSTSECIVELCKHLPDDLKEKAQFFCHNWPKYSNTQDGVLNLINTLKNKGYSLYVLSNAGYDFMDYWPEFGLESYFDGVIVSAFYKMKKPDNRIYQLITDTYELRKEECLYIDDREDNIEAGIKFGFDSILFQNIKELEEKLIEKRVL